jgi:uncharacterized membrane protein required for colicin V production
MITNIILVILILGFIGTGAKDGFVHTAGRLIGAVIGIIVAKAYYSSIASFFTLFLPISWASVLSFLLIFVLITRLVGFAFKLVDGAFHILSFLPFLKSINSLLGGILGFIEGLLIVGGAVYLIIKFSPAASLVLWLKASSVALWVQGVFLALLGILL